MRLLGLLLLCACDPQVDGDYAGDAIAELHGTVSALGPAEVARMVIRWSDDDPIGPGALVTPLALSTSYPAQFRAAIIDLPPAAALLRPGGEPGLTEGYLFALGADGATLGTDYDHVLVWLPEAAAEGSRTAAYLGGAAGPGFTVRDRVAAPVLSAEQEGLAARCIARALAQGWPRERAETTCRAAHGYQLLPSAQGLATRWQVRVVAGSP